MKTFYTLLSCIQLFLLTNKNIIAQDPPIEWGKIPRADLEMKSYPPDTNASALILCDYGESKFDNSLNVVFNALFRVKVFTTSGYELGSKSISVYTKDGLEEIDDIEGTTYSLDDNGEIIETELDDNDIFVEDIDKYRKLYKFTMPALKPGCVFEIRYTITSQNLKVNEWTFQFHEPVRWSEYRIIAPKQFVYATVTRGYELWEINETNEVSQVFRDNASIYLGRSIVPCNQYRWAVKDAPAIRDEPYITTPFDYMNKVDVQLASYSLVGMGTKRVLEDWPKLIEEFRDDIDFGKKIEVSSDVEELASKLTLNLNTQDEKMKAIYYWVATSINSEGNRVFANQKPSDLIESKKGSNADVTFLLISLLKSAGITSYPVIASTRGNGRIQELYPIYSQFNYVLVKAIIGTKTYFLDPTDPNRPFDLLPSKILNVKGLVIKEGKPEWVIFRSDKKNNSAIVINTEVNKNGFVKANFEVQQSDYRALRIRTLLKDKKDSEIVEDLFKTSSAGFTIDSVLIANKDSAHLPINIQFWVSSDTYTQTNGDMIYINPSMIDKYNENPFKSTTRKFPIDYGHKSSEVLVTNIKLPSGYKLREAFLNKTFSMGGSLFYSRVCQQENNLVQIMQKVEIKDSEIQPSYYQQLKNFYAQIISAQEELIVLSNKE